MISMNLATGRKSRNADYKLRRQPPPQPSQPQAVSNLRTFGAKAPSILRTFPQGPSGPGPVNLKSLSPLNLLNPFEPGPQSGPLTATTILGPAGPSNLRTSRTFGPEGRQPAKKAGLSACFFAPQHSKSSSTGQWSLPRMSEWMEAPLMWPFQTLETRK